MKNIEHLGIAVKDIKLASETYAALFGVPSFKTEEVESEKVITEFFKVGDAKIELLAATHPDSVINKFIDRKGEGIHHIAFEVTDIYAEIERLKTEGFVFINDVPKRGADNKLICFLSPKSGHGVLIELCQEIK